MFPIDPLREVGFSWPTALSLASASRLSYEQRPAVENFTAKSGFTRCDFLDVDDTQGYIAQTDDLVLIVFRGSESLADWLGNMDVTSADWSPHGVVHAGFLKAYGAVRDVVNSLVTKPGMSRKKAWLTGHSLGGALATIAAAELKDSLAIDGVYTFGQPRLANAQVQAVFRTHLKDRFFRFVNNRDLVTRLPWNFEHVGELIHFDEYGQVKQAFTEAEANKLEEPPLTEAEFEQMQDQINALRAKVGLPGDPVTEGVVNVSIKGLFPGLTEHQLDRYIAIIRRFIPSASVDPALAIEQDTRRMASTSRESTRGGARPEALSQPQDVPVLLRLKSSDWKAPDGLKVNSRFGTVISAQAPSDLVPSLQQDPGVVSIEMSRDAGGEELTLSLPFIRADVVHRPPIGEQGDSALVGIVDTGIDVMHEAFLDDNGRSRILAIWNQRDGTGLTPKAVDPANFTQDTGTLYLADEINKFVDGTKPPPPALRDPNMHGTHVASIAAGRGNGTLGDGMAPQAGIVLVIPNMKTAPGDPPSLGYSASHVDALHFLKSVAKGGNAVLAASRPIAVNVSLGMNAGAHDGSSTLEAAFDSITNSGRDPSYVIVKSAGNERGCGGHVQEQLFNNGLVTVEWESTAIPRLSDYIEAWYDSLDSVEFTLADPAGRSSPVVSQADPSAAFSLGGNFCHLELTQLHPDNGASRLVLIVREQVSPIQIGPWSLSIIAKSIRSRNAIIDLWIERDNSRAVQFVHPEDDLTLSIPGTANTVITVGACNSHEPLQLTRSSSFGLTRDERPKPDICAPGTGIIAARAGDPSGVIDNSGTSMAAPHVTGALALVMSKRHKQGLPQYNARQLQAALVRTVKNFSGIHNKGFGYGVLDAEELYNSL